MNSFGYKSPKNLDHWTAGMCFPSWFWKSYLSLIPISFLFNSQYGFYPGIHRNRCDKREWYFFLLSSILALNHTVFCHFFFYRFSWFPPQTSFGLLMCGLGGWLWLGLSSFSHVNVLSHSFCHSWNVKYASTHLAPLLFRLAVAAYLPASQTVFHNASQTTLWWILILKVPPWVSWSESGGLLVPLGVKFGTSVNVPITSYMLSE